MYVISVILFSINLIYIVYHTSTWVILVLVFVELCSDMGSVPSYVEMMNDPQFHLDVPIDTLDDDHVANDNDYDPSMDVEDVFEISQTRVTGNKRQVNYTNDEDIALVKAWESVTLDAVTGNDQTGRNYWQRIEDKFYRVIAEGGGEPSSRTLRSLQGRYDAIKTCCSRWGGCLEQVRQAPPSGFTIDDYVSILYVHFGYVLYDAQFDMIQGIFI